MLSDRFPESPTGITICEKPGTYRHQFLSELSREGVVAAERLDRIRFSSHIYNSHEQIVRGIQVLEQQG